jgi:hypothetical protein
LALVAHHQAADQLAALTEIILYFRPSHLPLEVEALVITPTLAQLVARVAVLLLALALVVQVVQERQTRVTVEVHLVALTSLAVVAVVLVVWAAVDQVLKLVLAATVLA